VYLCVVIYLVVQAIRIDPSSRIRNTNDDKDRVLAARWQSILTVLISSIIISKASNIFRQSKTPRAQLAENKFLADIKGSRDTGGTLIPDPIFQTVIVDYFKFKAEDSWQHSCNSRLSKQLAS